MCSFHHFVTKSTWVSSPILHLGFRLPQCYPFSGPILFDFINIVEEKMSDNRRRFVTVHRALKALYPTEPRGNQARHLTTLAMIISGIVGSKNVHLGAIASKVPTPTKVESRVKRFSRFLSNQRIDFDGYYLPYARQLLANLAHQTLVFIMDGSPVGRGCRTLMLCVSYKNRALPLGWLVAEGNRGHFSQENHLSLVKQVQQIVPVGASLLGALSQ